MIHMSHLGSLDVSHVISEQLCEFQLLVRCNSSLDFLQKHKRRHVEAATMPLLIRTIMYNTIGFTYSELLKQVCQLLQVPEKNEKPQHGKTLHKVCLCIKIITLYTLILLFICCAIISRESVQSGRDVDVIIRNICNNGN